MKIFFVRTIFFVSVYWYNRRAFISARRLSAPLIWFMTVKILTLLVEKAKK